MSTKQVIHWFGRAFDLALLRNGLSWKSTVPQFIGMPVPEMWGLASRERVKVQMHHVSAERPVPGRIVGQEPKAGARVPRDSVVVLEVTFEPAPLEQSKGPFG